MPQITSILTEAERGVAAVYGIFGAFGAGVSFMAVSQLNHGQLLAHGLGLYQVWMVLTGAIGAISALYISREWFGYAGRTGFFQALRGSFAVTFIAPVISGSLTLPLYGTMFGPFTLAITFIGAPSLALIWAANLFGAHHAYRRLHFERDSVYRAVLPSQRQRAAKA